jgi:hypothetical protein
MEFDATIAKVSLTIAELSWTKNLHVYIQYMRAAKTLYKEI